MLLGPLLHGFCFLVFPMPSEPWVIWEMELKQVYCQQGAFEQSLYREASEISRSMATPLRWQVAKQVWG